MMRREIVVLVSRALAVIQVMSALMEASYLPQFLMALWHRIGPLRFLDLSSYWSVYEIESTLALILRIALLLLAAYLFWNCGPGIENFLVPKSSESREPDGPDPGSRLA
jgi:small-conductance mechanosensitive channel